VTPDAALNPIDEPKLQPPPTTGMTTKVVKGSIWTLIGSVLPMGVAFISTPFIIRFLGSEAYGVLLLVLLIPTYFTFADLGMGIASTKFASEALGEGNREKEARVVWTAAAIALISTLIVAIPIFALANQIIVYLNVPEYLRSQATIGLRIATASFVLGILGSVVNSPMLSRLRMDLNTITQAGPRVMLSFVTPFILYFGGGIVEVVSWSFIVSVAAFAIIVFFSARLLPELFKARADRKMFRPLLRFGGAWFVAMVAAILLINLEKLFLTKMVSVKALAYYSVAFTFASMATMFSSAMSQSLLPAFSQLLSSGKREEFDALFARSIRLNIIWLLPVLMLMFVVARPFFTLWAGEEFGVESTAPFYVLLAGLSFNLLAYIPHASIMATGRTDVFAKLYWIELALYVVVAWILISYFGIVGAAAAWSIRVILDAFLIIRLSRIIANTKFKFLAHAGILVLGILVLSVPVALTLIGVAPIFLIAASMLSLPVYAALIWKRFVDDDERKWISSQINTLLSPQ
jgi:O-antigen/teichoic acid export membrane protein